MGSKKVKEGNVKYHMYKKCPICFSTGFITNLIKGRETDAWFCSKCGGLIRFDK